MNAIDTILAASREVPTPRDLNAVFMKVAEEVGELATEIAILTGASYKEPGPDGVVGEACDAIIALVDLIYLMQPGVEEADLLGVVTAKLSKWKRKAQENREADR